MAEEKVMTEEPVVEEKVDIKTEETPETDKENSTMNFEYNEDDIPARRLFSSHKEDMNFLRDKWILSRIKDDDLMEYLRLEQKRNDQLQESREVRNKRIMFAFTLTVSLIAAVVAIYFLKDNPVLLTN
ncbi:MAG: hypothetical protein ACI4UH_05640, partial [Dorea sp.]